MGIRLECTRDVLSTALPPVQLKSPVLHTPAKVEDRKQKILITHTIIKQIENPGHQSPTSTSRRPCVGQESLTVPACSKITPIVEELTEQVQEDEDAFTPAPLKPATAVDPGEHLVPNPMPPTPRLEPHQSVPEKDNVPGPKEQNDVQVSLPERTAAHAGLRSHANGGGGAGAGGGGGGGDGAGTGGSGRRGLIPSGIKNFFSRLTKGRRQGDEEDDDNPPSQGERKPRQVRLREIPMGVLTNEGLPVRDSLWGTNDRERDENITPTIIELPWHIRLLNEKDDLNTIAVYLAAFRRNLKDCGVDFHITHHPLSFIDDAERDGALFKYTNSDKRNGHQLNNLYLHSGEGNWATLCVTRRHHLRGIVWHHWALAVISEPKQLPVQTQHDTGIHLLMYDSRPPPEPTRQRERDYFGNYLQLDQQKLLEAFVQKFRTVSFAVNRSPIVVQGEHDPLRLTMWWIWAVARYEGRPYQREGDLDDPRWRLANSRHMDLTPNRSRTIEARIHQIIPQR